MSEKQIENSKIRDYLLGNSSSTDEKFEERLMTDDEFFQEFQIEEDDLIQDYADGNLSVSEKEKFENHFLISKERQDKLEFSNSLRKQLDQKEKDNILEVKNDNKEENNSFFSLSFLQKTTPAFATIIVVFGLLWFVFLSAENQSPLEKEFAQKNSIEFNELEKYDSKIKLLSGSVRGSTKIKKLQKKDISKEVLFRLALPTEFDSHSDFEVQIIKNLKVIFTQKGIQKYNTKSYEELRLLLPGSLFEKGEYTIKVKNSILQDSSISYPFFVE